MKNNLLQTLLIVRAIITGNPSTSTEDLRTHFGLSDSTFKRHISEARHLGAKLKARRVVDAWFWQCENADSLILKGTLDQWIALEETRSLT